MTHSTASKALLASALLLAHTAQAAEITFNGFASFVGGTAVEQEELPDGTQSELLADPTYATIDGEKNRHARYGEDVTYRPDSNYGLQVNADMGKGLKATAQLTGKGANDFNAEIEWAYMSYNFTETTSFQAGRQRLPLYFYSDFLDVGYAYHWVRPPVDVYATTFSTYDGASLAYDGSLGDWDAGAKLYTGSTISEHSRFGEFTSDQMAGLVLTTGNEWLRLRASYMGGDFYIKESQLTNKDNKVDALFASAAAYFTLGNGFIAAETTLSEATEEGAYLSSPTSPVSEVQFDELNSYMLTAGYQFGDFTPHVTYSESEIHYSPALNPAFEGVSSKTESVIGGIRWDFHPSAAMKLEYSRTLDKSHPGLIELVGKYYQVSVVNLGFDVVF